MKTTLILSCLLSAAPSAPLGVAAANGQLSYLIGGIIALLVMGYLVYSLIHPEKF